MSKKDARLEIRLSKKEKELIKEIANSKNMTVSEYILLYCHDNINLDGVLYEKR